MQMTHCKLFAKQIMRECNICFRSKQNLHRALIHTLLAGVAVILTICSVRPLIQGISNIALEPANGGGIPPAESSMKQPRAAPMASHAQLNAQCKTVVLASKFFDQV